MLFSKPLGYNTIMYCSRCGKKIGNSAFCQYCGKAQKSLNKFSPNKGLNKLIAQNIFLFRRFSFLNNIKSIYIFQMVLALFFFSYVIIFLLPAVSSDLTIFLVYPMSFFHGVMIGNLIDIVGLTILMLIPIIFFLFQIRIHNKHFKYLSFIKSTFSGFLIIIFSAYFALFIISIFNLAATINFSNKLNKNPEALVVTYDIDAIVKKLDTSKIVPGIIETSKEKLGAVVASRLQNKKLSAFYIEVLTPFVAKFNPIKPMAIDQGLIMVGDDLVFFELKREELEKIAPYLGYSLVKKHFDPRFIKFFPELRVLGRQDYIKVRDDQVNEQLNAIDYLIDVMESYISQNLANIALDKSKITANKNGLSDSINSKESTYNQCITAGFYSYYSNSFIKLYSEETCRERSNSWDDLIAKWRTNIADWENSLAYDQSQLVENRQLLKSITGWRAMVESQKMSTPLELGVFYDEKNIDIAFDWTNTKSIMSFLVTLSHEYIHYSSHISNERYLTLSFEEALTEYYSRSIIKENFNKDTNVGYPFLMNVMSQLFDKLPDDDLEEIYFTKNEDQLISLLDSTFGKDFYKKNRTIIVSLPYLSGKEGVDSANTLLKAIGGEPVNEQDYIGEVVEI
ncbi:MAG: hypothetical protein ACD_61C00040G0006 [uncultured bacterium]|nr:MAG: hypothetical protein ACD_61C00040G0006 [uncultured bacterium]